jgi:alpha-tubulin suppressor-like RCC1 family protein
MFRSIFRKINTLGVLASATLAAALGLGVCQPALGKGVKPTVSQFTVIPSSLPAAGGQVRVSAAVSDATSCSLSANKPIAGLPVTVACSRGNVSQEVTLPANRGRKKAAKYKLSLKAEGEGGTSKGTTKATVAAPTSSRVLATQVSGGHNLSCALLSNGHIDCWGENVQGGLGNGTKTNSETPVEVTGITSATQVSAGYGFACALLSSGHIDCWGNGSDTPVEVTGITSATQVSATGGHNCALLSSGHVDCWGENQYGQLGNGTTTGSATPVEVTGIANAMQVGVGYYDSCALLSNGHVKCWGISFQGELGNGTFRGPEECERIACSKTPVEVQAMANATQLAVGGFHSCARLSTQNVKCWGYGEYHGALGNGATSNSDTPVEVTGIANATQVSAGEEQSCALLSTEHLKCWGDNEHGELGNGSTTNSDTPVEVTGIAHATQVANGAFDSCALLSSEEVDCWGWNESGQLGNGTTTNSATPVKVTGLP